MLRKIQDPIIKKDFEEGFNELFTYQTIGNGFARAAVVLTKANRKAYSVVLESFLLAADIAK